MEKRVEGRNNLLCVIRHLLRDVGVKFICTVTFCQALWSESVSPLKIKAGYNQPDVSDLSTTVLSAVGTFTPLTRL